MSSSCLVTGGAGYIGSHCILALLDAGYKSVICLDNLSTGNQSVIPDGVIFEEGDLGDTVFLKKVFDTHKIETVFHFAASISVPESVQDPEKYYKNNTSNTLVLLQQCRKHKVKEFIFSSTAAVYGDVQDDYVTLQTPTAPINPYGKSKLYAEYMIKDICIASDMKYGILRYFNVSGADKYGRSGPNPNNKSGIFSSIKRVIEGHQEKFEVFGKDYPTPDGTCMRDYIHVSDLAMMHIQLKKYLEEDGESAVFNCGYGRGISVQEVLNETCKVHDIKGKISYIERRVGDPAMVVMKKEENSIFDIEPAPLKEMIDSVIRWKKI